MDGVCHGYLSSLICGRLLVYDWIETDSPARWIMGLLIFGVAIVGAVQSRSL
jgi:hypothetical protein